MRKHKCKRHVVRLLQVSHSFILLKTGHYTGGHSTFGEKNSTFFFREHSLFSKRTPPYFFATYNIFHNVTHAHSNRNSRKMIIFWPMTRNANSFSYDLTTFRYWELFTVLLQNESHFADILTAQNSQTFQHKTCSAGLQEPHKTETKCCYKLW